MFPNPFKKRIGVHLQEKGLPSVKETFSATARSISRKKQINYSRENFEYPNLCLHEVYRAMSTDSYIAESQLKYKEKIFKAGHHLTSATQECADYINKRLDLMSYMGDTPIEILFQEIADDLITYSNAFLLKVRTDKLAYINAQGFFKENPVGAYIRLEPYEVIIVKDKFDNILRYELELAGAENQKIDKEDMVHYYMHRKAGEKYGTPRLEPVLEDVKALRDIEGDVLSLIHRFCFPLYHVKVGLAQNGYSGTQTDVDNVKYEIQNMAEDGMLITNEKVEILTIGAEGNALDLNNYLGYFENRVFSGLNTSDTQMGRDNNNASPDTLEAQIHDSVKHIQRTFAIITQHYIFNELLLEGGYNPILHPEEKVELVFNEISLDTRIKVENHEMLKYQSNVQSLDETRLDLGKKDMANQEDFHNKNVTVNGAIEQENCRHEHAMELATLQAKLAPKPTAGSSSGGSNKKATKKTRGGNGKTTQKKSNALVNNNRPQNQHGIYSVKIKESLEQIQDFSKKDKEIYNQCYKIYYNLRNEVLEKGELEAYIIASERLKAYGDTLLQNQFEKSWIYFNQLDSLEETSEIALDISKQEIQVLLNQAIDKLLTELQTNNESFEKWSYRLDFIYTYWGQKYFWYCFAQMAHHNQYKTLTVEFSRPEEKKGRKTTIVLNRYVLSDIPPFHPYCKCKLILTKKGDK